MGVRRFEVRVAGPAGISIFAVDYMDRNVSVRMSHDEATEKEIDTAIDLLLTELEEVRVEAKKALLLRKKSGALWGSQYDR